MGTCCSVPSRSGSSRRAFQPKLINCRWFSSGGRKGDGGLNMLTPLIPDMAVFQRKLATLPLVTYRAGESVLTAGSTTGRLLILKEGAIAVVKEGVEIARVTEPGA